MATTVLQSKHYTGNAVLYTRSLQEIKNFIRCFQYLLLISLLISLLITAERLAFGLRYPLKIVTTVEDSVITVITNYPIKKEL